MTNTVVLAAGPNGLGVTRSLYLKNVAAKAITRSQQDITNMSRIPTSKHVVEGESDEEQHKWLLKFLLTEPKGTVLIPTSDWFVTFIAEHEETLQQHCLYVIPSQEIAEILIDKKLETEYVAKLIPTPKTVQVLTDAEQLKAELGLPIIIKPRSHKYMVLGTKNIVVTNDEELGDFFDKFAGVKEGVIAQQIIPGEDFEQWVCNCSFDENSEMVQGFTFNRLRLSPSHYGVTSYAKAELNEQIMEYCKKLGKALNYVGPAMVEFKKDPRDGEYKYIELNPRLGMCNFFDTQCGINNAYVTYRLAKKLPIERDLVMKEGSIFLSFYEDFFSRRRDGESIPYILRDYVGHSGKRHVFIYFVWWDPYPALKLAVKQVRALLRSVAKKVFK